MLYFIRSLLLKKYGRGNNKRIDDYCTSKKNVEKTSESLNKFSETKDPNLIFQKNSGKALFYFK
jgi:hypothetical protein